jgi:hypothetical protein
MESSKARKTTWAISFTCCAIFNRTRNWLTLCTIYQLVPIFTIQTIHWLIFIAWIAMIDITDLNTGYSKWIKFVSRPALVAFTWQMSTAICHVERFANSCNVVKAIPFIAFRTVPVCRAAQKAVGNFARFYALWSTVKSVIGWTFGTCSWLIT